jgi:ATP-dependent RNA helicase DeaD
MTNTDAPAGFAGLGLPQPLVDALTARGITKPTPVQEGVIPLALAGGDILAQARTGSGKTLAFLLPLAARIAAGELRRAWIVCPTRELAQQAAREALTVFGPGRTATLVGGVAHSPQLRELRANPALVIGTPGRMCDHLQHGTLAPDAEIVVLDEADQMLDLGFRDELERLVRDLGQGAGRWLFSATFPPEVQAAVDRWMEAPKTVRLDREQGASHVTQRYVVARRGEEQAALARLLHHLEPARSLVFVRTREDVEVCVRAIASEGIEAAGISGDLAQDARERVLGRFRAGTLPVLVGTDVAARGIDVPGVTHVFNYGLPTGSEAYVHRVGRTARAGATGEAWTVIGPQDRVRFQRLVQRARCQVEAVPLPTAATLVNAKRERLARRVAESLGEGLTLPTAFQALVTEHSAETVLAALVHRLHPDAPPERVEPPPSARGPGVSPSRTPRGEGGGGSEQGVPLFVGAGGDDGLMPGTLVALLCHHGGVRGVDIGKIRVFPRHSQVVVSSRAAPAILAHALHHRGRMVPVRIDRGPGQRR